MSKIQYKFVKLSEIITPSIIVDRNSEIVKYGKDNLFPQHLLEISVQSSLHTAILDKKTKMLVGEGFTFDGDNKNTQLFLDAPNPYEDMNTILEKCAVDLEIFGGFNLQTVWSRDKKSISEIYHLPFQNIRSTKMNDDNQIENYYYNTDWKKYTKLSSCTQIPSFSLLNREGSQLIYAKKYNSLTPYYPLPSYIGALNDINTLYQISVYHNSTISNNFQPGLMIVFRGPIPTPEEQDDIIDALEDKYKGSKNAGTPSVFFLDNEQQKPLIEQTQVSDLDKQYSTLTEAVKESVVMGHSIPRIVAGLEKSGSLGGSKEIVEANMVFYTEYVLSNQQFIEKYFNKIMKINGLDEIYIQNSKPSLHLYSENLLKEVLTKDEIRELFGYSELVKDIKNDDLDNE